MMTGRSCLWVIALFVGLMGAVCAWCAEIGDDVESALVKGDWAGAMSAIQKDDALVGDACARLIVAHSKLATNANNEGTALFFTVGKGEEVEAWFDWTKGFVQRHPDSEVALYLHADAYARRGELNQAKELLDKVLAAKPDFALGWNARGLVSSLQAIWTTRRCTWTERCGSGLTLLMLISTRDSWRTLVVINRTRGLRALTRR